ncbi:MAG: hypothetical protein IPJ81_16260 [Chitinophagaceae bacterium]|nr:hypothetical protein [Chitinophagaceae bacterium]
MKKLNGLKAGKKRFKELDQVKVWDNLKPHFNPHANASLLKEEFTQVEREAIAFAIFNKLSYNERDNFRSLFKIKKENFSDVDEITLRQMTRFFFLDTLPPAVIYSGFTPDALVCLKVAGQYFPTVLEEITNKQKVAADKRGVKVAAKVKSLQEQKKQFKAPKEKKPASKKQAK